MATAMEKFLFKAEVKRLAYPEAQAQYPEVWPVEAEEPVTEGIWDINNPYYREICEADTVIFDYTEKNRSKAKRYASLRKEKAERNERKNAKRFSNWDPKGKRAAKKYSHKIVRQGRMPRTDFYLISGSQYYDGKYHNSYKAVV